MKYDRVKDVCGVYQDVDENISKTLKNVCRMTQDTAASGTPTAITFCI